MTKNPHKIGDGEHSFGEGLYLIVVGGSRRWMVRFTVAGSGKSKEKMYIGSLANFTQDEAREAAVEAKRLAARGIDPREERKKKERGSIPTFWEFAQACMTRWLPELKNEKHREKWFASLEKHTKPMHKVAIDKVTTADVIACLEPIWKTIPIMADEVRSRIAAILDAAVTAGLREAGLNPAQWNGHLKNHFRTRKQRGTVRGSHRAIDYRDIPDFIARLRQRSEPTARLLELAILTTVRTNKIVLMRIGQLKLAATKWLIPIEQMKIEHKIEHHDVPLMPRAMEILREQLACLEDIYGELRDDMFVWPGRSPGEPLSSHALLGLLYRMKADSTTHGFRSCFRTWADDQIHEEREGVPAESVGTPKYHDDAIELCLAHITGRRSKRAYRRGTMYRAREGIMKAWAEHCEPRVDNVVTLHKRA